MKQKLWVYGLCAALLVTLCCGNGAAFAAQLVGDAQQDDLTPATQGALQGELAPTNPAFEAYLLKGGAEGEEGIVPTPFLLPEGKGKGDAQQLPAAVDLRSTGMVSPVKDQKDEYTCWAFAATAAAETLLRTVGWGDATFSENHMKYALTKEGGNTWGYDRGYFAAGNDQMASAYLVRGSGVVLESEDPYTYYGGIRSVEITNAKKASYSVPTVQWFNTSFSFANVTDRQARINSTKALLAQGNVVTLYLYVPANFTRLYLGSDDTSYYYNGGSKPASFTHEVALVGYDDNYPKENFEGSASGIPATDGAFLFKNSWGSDRGQEGFFYLSYEDSYAVGASMVIPALRQAHDFDTAYQYDPLGVTSIFLPTSGDNTNTAVANLFSVQEEGELLGGVSFGVANASAEYTVSVCCNISADATDLTGCYFTPLAEGSMDMPGYYTVVVPDTLLTGDQFAVCVELTATDGNAIQLPVEKPRAGYSSAATSQPGQSFILQNDTFYDVWSRSELVNSNVCVKAHTRSESLAVDLTGASVSMILPQTDIQALSASLQQQLTRYDVGETQVLGIARGQQSVTEGNAATGMTLRLQAEGGREYALTLCVRGDVASRADGCGDGCIAVADLAAVRLHVLGIAARQLQGIFLRAADVNLDGAVDVLDMVEIQSNILRLRKLE